ncbi:MAG: hypothetical protein RLZZ524_357 [Pseudomonadota bacterium]
MDLLADAAQAPAWRLDLADSELAAITPDGHGGLLLRLAVAVLVPTAASRAAGAEPEHALGVSVQLDAVEAVEVGEGLDTAALADVAAAMTGMTSMTAGRIRHARVVNAGTGLTLALPCPGRVAGPLRIELQPAHGPTQVWRAAGLTVSLADNARQLGVHAC